MFFYIIVDEDSDSIYNKENEFAGDTMISRIRIYESTGFDPHYNLAVEKQLMDITAPDECILYLWQNQNTVVIGRNQNDWAECRTSLLEEENGVLARRLSGGGAVFHDLGNLNFTFLVGRDNYDLDKQLAVIQRACHLAGIRAEKSGRNDLLAEGYKFSGNAFYHNQTHAYHHGTLLIDVDMDKLQRYLSPPKAKLEAKGIQSVRSRVINLKELNPELTIAKMKQYMTAAFEDVYGCNAEPAVLSPEDNKQILQNAATYGSWDYLYGSPLAFSFDAQQHFSWGNLQLQLQAKGGMITAAKVYSDAMDWQLAATVENTLTGCRFETKAMCNSIRNSITQHNIQQDLCNFLENQQL